jgi:hypothetical protein
MLVAAVSGTLAQSAPYTQQPDAGPLKSKVQVEFREDHGETAFAGKIFVTDSKSKDILQTLDTRLMYPDLGQLEFDDLNGDGYQDLMFINDRSSTGDALLSDVFLWVPAQSRFVKSQSLSQAGEIAKAKHKGCVTVSDTCNIGFVERELCFNKPTGKWRVVRDAGCRPLEP